jgi:hypothetical protein
MRSHALNRTSPFGGPFIGTCFLCGRAGVTLSQMAMEECPNIRGLDPSEALLEAIGGPFQEPDDPNAPDGVF